jgi:hypothetical protein
MVKKSKKNGPSYTKRPINKARKTNGPKLYTTNPSHIANKMKRSEMYGRYLQDKRTLQRQVRQTRIKEAEALGEEVVKKTPRTIDNTREVEITVVDPNDPEVQADEASDEFARFLSGETKAKLLITTRPSPSQQLFFLLPMYSNSCPIYTIIPVNPILCEKFVSLRPIATLPT